MINRGAFILVFFGVVFSLIVSGCSHNLPKETRIGGVDMAFLNNRPPIDSIFENQDFTVGIQLVNNIPNDIDNAKVCVSDTPADSYGGIQGEDCVDLAIPAAISFEGNTEPYKLDPLYFSAEPYKNLERGVDDTNIFSTLTYYLVTKSDVDICLIKDPSITDKSFECESQVTLSGSDIKSDFAPLVVDRIESRIVPEGESNRIRLDLYFRKSPIGNLIDSDTGKERFKIDLGFASTSSSFQCNPLIDGKVEMNDLTKKITCFSLLDIDKTPYIDTLHIDLSYTYKTTISTGSIPLEKVFKEGTL